MNVAGDLSRKVFRLQLRDRPIIDLLEDEQTQEMNQMV